MKDATMSCYNCGRYMGADYHMCANCEMLFCSDCIDNIDESLCQECSLKQQALARAGEQDA